MAYTHLTKHHGFHMVTLQLETDCLDELHADDLDVTQSMSRRQSFMHHPRTAITSTMPLRMLINQMNPSADVRALTTISADISGLAEGTQLTVNWRGKPLFIRHRMQAELAQVREQAVSALPNTDARNSNLPGEAAGDFGGWSVRATGRITIPRDSFAKGRRRRAYTFHLWPCLPTWCDELVVHCLDRLGRSTRDVLNLVHELDAKRASLRVLEPEVTTAGDKGRMVITVLGMVADMELKFIRDRQRAGIAAAKDKVVYKGRRKSVDEKEIRRLANEGVAKAQIARDLGVSRMTVYRALAKAETEADVD